MFGSPWWLAAALPVVGGAWALLAAAAARRRAVTRALGEESTLARSAEDAAPRRAAAAALRLSALALICAALAGPRWGVELVETSGAARQVVVAIDLSLSMRAADVKPTRLDRAKSSLTLLIDQLKGDRVGVVAFAGDAQTVCPLTSDSDAAKELLNALEVGAIPTPGTAIGTALRRATGMLAPYPGAKSVVLLTDGEDHKSDPLGAAREAAAAGVRVYAVGIGTPEGEPIPLEGGGYKKDARGSTVVSRLGEDALAEIARTSGGTYSRTTPGEDEIAAIAAKIKESDAAKGGPGGSANRWKNRYAWPLGLAFLLLLVEMSLPLIPSRPAGFEGALRDANAKYADGKYEDALEGYGDASARRPSDPRPVFNAGDALFRLDRDSDAAGAFASVAAAKALPAPLRAAALYNLGDARYRSGDYAGAADAYRGALALDPRDTDARRNLAVALLRKKVPPPPKKNPNKDPNKPNQPPPDPKKDQDKNGGGGGGGAGPTKQRPQDALTREDAERVLRAVAEREKAERRNAAKAPSYSRKPPPPRPPGEEDW